jgi:hypothetical protein
MQNIADERKKAEDNVHKQKNVRAPLECLSGQELTNL